MAQFVGQVVADVVETGIGPVLALDDLRDK